MTPSLVLHAAQSSARAGRGPRAIRRAVVLAAAVLGLLLAVQPAVASPAQPPSVAQVLAVAYRTAGLDRDGTRSLIWRARLAGLVPWVTLRAGRDESWTDDDPTIGHSTTLEVRATWRLDRLLFDGRELQVASSAAARRRERQRLARRVIRAYFTWRRTIASRAATRGGSRDGDTATAADRAGTAAADRDGAAADATADAADTADAVDDLGATDTDDLAAGGGTDGDTAAADALLDVAAEAADETRASADLRAAEAALGHRRVAGLRAAEAAAELDAMTDGWFSAQLARPRRAGGLSGGRTSGVSEEHRHAH
ncbi:MAG TPA: hypothetical protein VGM88_14785 [Kofleriaceae bacterium]